MSPHVLLFQKLVLIAFKNLHVLLRKSSSDTQYASSEASEWKLSQLYSINTKDFDQNPLDDAIEYNRV